VAFGLRTGDGGLRILGSGVLVDRSGIVVTAGHVFTDTSNALKELRKAQPTAVGQIMILGPARYRSNVADDEPNLEFDYHTAVPAASLMSSHHDLAVIKVNTPVPLLCAPVDYSATPSEGDIVAACGFPYGAEFHEGKTVLSSFLTGIVSAVVPHPVVPRDEIAHYALQMPVNPGNSGGPVFDPTTGAVVGIISRRSMVEGIPTGLCVAEPIHVARDGIAEMKKRFS
jgi:S1-C subfamily serine protease